MVDLLMDYIFLLWSFQCSRLLRLVYFCFIPAANFNPPNLIDSRSLNVFVRSLLSMSFRLHVSTVSHFKAFLGDFLPKCDPKDPLHLDWRIPSELCLWAFSWNQIPETRYSFSLIGKIIALGLGYFCSGCLSPGPAGAAVSFLFAGNSWVTFITFPLQIAQICPRFARSQKRY